MATAIQLHHEATPASIDRDATSPAASRQNRGRRRRALIPTSSVTALRLAAILDRWMPYAVDTKRCDCVECASIRSRPFECGGCGYRGEPLVHPCVCVEEHERHGWVGGPTPDACLPSAQGGSCCHGNVECPVCVDAVDRDGGYWEDEANNGHPWGIIRDLRAAVSGAPDSALERSRSIEARIFRDVEGFTACDIHGGNIVGGDDWRPFSLSIRSADDVRALAYALLRAADAGVLPIQRR